MSARVTRVQGSAAKVDQGIRHFEEKTLPASNKLAGFKGTFLLIDRTSGKGIAVTFYQSEKALQASEQPVSQLREQARPAFDITGDPIVDTYEVVVNAGAGVTEPAGARSGRS